MALLRKMTYKDKASYSILNVLYILSSWEYDVAEIGKLLKNIGVFCRI